MRSVFYILALSAILVLSTAALAAEVNNIHKTPHVREKLAEIRDNPPSFEIEGHTFHVGQRVLVLRRSNPSQTWSVEEKSVGEDDWLNGVDTPFVLVNARREEDRWLVTLALESDWMRGTGTFQVPDGRGTWQRKMIPMAT